MSSANTKASKLVLDELRKLKQVGIAQAAGRVQELLGMLQDGLDLEAAGALLSGKKTREQLAETGGFREQRIALLGSSTLDALPNLLTAHSLKYGILPEIRLAGFNQWLLEILGGATNLKDLSPRVVACLLDDWAVFEAVTDPLDLEEVEARCAAFPSEISEWIDACQRSLGGLVVLCTVPLSTLRSDRLIDYRSKARLAAAWHRMNASLLELANEKPRTIVLAADSITAHVSTTFSNDRMRHIAGHAFAPDFLSAYAAELARIARADLGLAKKCLVLDLDNTLWNGVVGDDGVGGLRLGGAYPGSAHKELQALARDFMAQGVMLTVCSKNDDEVAREAIATHPEMLLRPDSFVDITANWEPKPDNLRAQAAQLNIGIDAMVFVDDNPVERDLMRSLLPQVTTVELAADPATYAAQLAMRGDFNLLAITDEDHNRTTQYQARTQRAEFERAASNIEDFLVSLDLQLTIEPLGPLNLKRIVQLFGKTNQFNLTGMRYGEDEITQLQESNAGAFFGARLIDRFGDNGLIAALGLLKDEDDSWVIDNFAMSCRVFSRSVENAVVGLVLRAAQAHGVPAVMARFVETAKNRKFAGFYKNLGFVDLDDDGVRFRHEFSQLIELPQWFRIIAGAEVFHAF